MLDLFQQLDSERSFNLIDNLIVEDSVRNSRDDDALVKMRARINKEYSNGVEADLSESPEYEEPTDDGYAGLAPLG